jgi:hypothetical protein
VLSPGPVARAVAPLCLALTLMNDPCPLGRVLVVDPDGNSSDLWHFVVMVDGAAVAGSDGMLRCDPLTGSITRVGEWAEWWGTAALLVRAASGRRPIVYDLALPPVPALPPRGPAGPPPRSTAGRAKAAGETLADRAQRAQQR